MRKNIYKVPGGKLLKAEIEDDGKRITHVKITGDFFLHPEDLLLEIERALIGKILNEDDIVRAVEGVLESEDGILFGCSPHDFAVLICMSGE